MTKRQFTSDELTTLLANPSNAFLNKSANDKYRVFANSDPFPDISNSLLNSKDIIQYVLTTGLVDPFTPECLLGATYTCEFSGDCIWWDSENKKHVKVLKEEEEPLSIKPNSIVFLGVKQMFYIPQYMALRFNLRVKNVYKGLLLGTGPIIDPGYVGNIFIPLHNLTSNEYHIKLKALLIDVEFTKLSKNNEWRLKSYQRKIVTRLDFRSISCVSKFFKYEIRKANQYETYIQDALIGDLRFFQKNVETPFVSSSIEAGLEFVHSTHEEIKNKLKRLSTLEVFSSFTIVSLLFFTITLVGSTVWYFISAYNINNTKLEAEECKKVIEQQNADFIKYKSETDHMIKSFEDRLNILEKHQQSERKAP
jgi:deoxycytidine triphosphate deaminase